MAYQYPQWWRGGEDMWKLEQFTENCWDKEQLFVYLLASQHLFNSACMLLFILHSLHVYRVSKFVFALEVKKVFKTKKKISSGNL